MLTRDLKSCFACAVGFAALIAAGCGPESTGDGLVLVRVSLAQTGSALSAAPTTQLATSGPIDLGNVKSLTVDLNSVQFQSAGSGWQEVSQHILDLDLFHLPTMAPIELGTAKVAPGTCQVRLFVSNAKITFDTPVTVGGVTLDGGDVVIPSGNQTGLKADGLCSIDESTKKVTLMFDGGATAGTIVVTGNGTIMLTPVIHVTQ